jgi:ribosome-associated protein
MESKQIASKCAQLCLEKKAKDVVILDFEKKSDVADFFILATVESDPQINAVTTHVISELKDLGVYPFNREGHFKESNWVIVDYVDVVVHVFKPEERLKFRLEDIWHNAKQIPVADEAGQ